MSIWQIFKTLCIFMETIWHSQPRDVKFNKFNATVQFSQIYIFVSIVFFLFWMWVSLRFIRNTFEWQFLLYQIMQHSIILFHIILLDKMNNCALYLTNEKSWVMYLQKILEKYKCVFPAIFQSFPDVFSMKLCQKDNLSQVREFIVQFIFSYEYFSLL